MITLDEIREPLDEASPEQLQGEEAAPEQLRGQEVEASRDSCAALARIFVDIVLEELGNNPKANLEMEI